MVSGPDKIPEAEIDRAEQEFWDGTAFHREGKLDEAVAAYATVLRLNPDHKECYNNLGVALHAQGKFQAAVAAYCRALAFSPNDAGTHSNMGNALRALGRFAEAEACHRRAIDLNPAFTEAVYNLGIVLKDQCRIDQAVACFGKVPEENPDHADAHWDRALAWLVDGEFEHGWPEYEWRWHLKEVTPRDFAEPLWTGEHLDGRTILLHAEQGMGDSIQFARYVPLVAAAGGQVVLECQPLLCRLFETLDGVAEIVPAGQSLPAFDVQAPVLSLPNILGTRMDTIPADIPYLAANQDLARKIHSNLERFSGGLKVGLVWAGKPSHKNDRNRSIGFKPFVGLLAMSQISFFSLQVGPRAEDMREAGCDGLAHDLSGVIKDFADSAAIIEALDLLITVDTAPAHLAGALGKPVWVLLPHIPDWRWLLERDDSPWYPSMRLFRQEQPGRWGNAFRGVVAALKEMTAAGLGGSGGA